VVRRSKHETYTRIADTSAYVTSIKFYSHAERLKNVSGAGSGRECTIAVFGNRNPGAGHDKGRASRDIV
jgi:hypothetical protein